MSDTSVQQGLCARCGKVANCTFPRAPHTPVLECEAFVTEEPLRVKRAVKLRRRSQPSAAGRGAPTQSDGLCVQCAKRDGCTFPRPEGGVWDCEEYQ